MPLAREQRNTLARVLRWSRSNGWAHDAYPYTWRSHDGQRHVRYDAIDQELVVDRMTNDPLRCRVAVVPVQSPEVAVDVLAALGCVPVELSPMGRGLLVGLGDTETTDGRIRMTYRRLIDENDRHGYMSTYCQHGLHDDCKMACKCCGAPCVCDRCLHTPTYSEPVPVMPSVDDAPDAFDGPASFVEAGQAFADWVDGRVSAEHAAEVLSKLARDGLIVSVGYHDEQAEGEAAGEVALMADLAAIIDGDEQ